MGIVGPVKANALAGEPGRWTVGHQQATLSQASQLVQVFQRPCQANGADANRW